MIGLLISIHAIIPYLLFRLLTLSCYKGSVTLTAESFQASLKAITHTDDVYKEIKSRAYKECSYWSRGKCLLYGMLLSPILGLVVHGSAYMIDQATGGSGLGAIYAYIGAALLAPIVMAVLGSIVVKKLHPIDAEVKEQITSIEETIRRS